MITKSRLEELKKEKAFIFYLLNNSVSIIELDDNYDISVDEYNKINNGKPTLYHNHNGVFQDICEMDKVFETEKDAKWASKYQRIMRTEYLDLPTWKEFDKNNKTICFIAKDWKCYELGFAFGDAETICLDKVALGVNTNQKTWKATEENYIKACDLCVKLFKGESDESICN